MKISCYIIQYVPIKIKESGVFVCVYEGGGDSTEEKIIIHVLLLWVPQTAPWNPKAFQTQTQCTGHLIPLVVINLNTQMVDLFPSICCQGYPRLWTPSQFFNEIREIYMYPYLPEYNISVILSHQHKQRPLHQQTQTHVNHWITKHQLIGCRV